MISDAIANQILDWMFNGSDPGTYTPYVSVHSGDPGGTGANEQTGGSAARTNASAAFPAASSRGCTSNASVQVTCAAGTWTHFGVWSAASGGTFLWGGRLESSITTSDGNTVTFASGDLKFAL